MARLLQRFIIGNIRAIVVSELCSWGFVEWWIERQPHRLDEVGVIDLTGANNISSFSYRYHYNSDRVGCVSASGWLAVHGGELTAISIVMLLILINQELLLLRSNLFIQRILGLSFSGFKIKYVTVFFNYNNKLGSFLLTIADQTLKD